MSYENGMYRYCGNCRYFVCHNFKMRDGCTHPLVPDWYPVGERVVACPLHKFIVDDEGDDASE